FVRSVNAYAFENYLPDCTVFLDITPEQAFARKHGADENDRMEREGLAFHNKVYQGYLKIAQSEPGRFIRVDAVGDKQQTFLRVLNALQAHGIL
ncbi:MAG: dTMP kinase, partial [Clostridia bacterium]|nr:dTMP kinase [Clostridia bacterium]